MQQRGEKQRPVVGIWFREGGECCPRCPPCDSVLAGTHGLVISALPALVTRYTVTMFLPLPLFYNIVTKYNLVFFHAMLGIRIYIAKLVSLDEIK